MTILDLKLLEAAIADIPHVGRFCGHGENRGQPPTVYCKLTKQICSKQINQICPDWKWHGLK